MVSHEFCLWSAAVGFALLPMGRPLVKRLILVRKLLRLLLFLVLEARSLISLLLRLIVIIVLFLLVIRLAHFGA